MSEENNPVEVVEITDESVTTENKGPENKEDEGFEELEILLGEKEDGEEIDPIEIDREDDSPPLRSMRERLREQNKELKQKEQRIKDAEIAAQQAAEQRAERIAQEKYNALLEQQRKQAELDAIPPMPDLWSPEIDGDTEKYNAAFAAHLKAKDAHAEKQKAVDAQRQKAEARHAALLSEFESEAKELAKKVPDLQTRFATVERVIKPELRGAIAEAFGAGAAAKLMAGLGANPIALAKLTKLQEDGEVLKFIGLASKYIHGMELKTAPRKTPGKVDTVIKQSGGVRSVNHDAVLDKMRKESKGDLTAVIAYKRKHGLT